MKAYIKKLMFLLFAFFGYELRKRRFPRKKVTFVVKCNLPKAEGFGLAFVKDISAGGLRMESETEFPVESILKLELSSFTVEARVVYCERKIRKKKDKIFCYGVEFINLTQNKLSDLNCFIETT